MKDTACPNFFSVVLEGLVRAAISRHVSRLPAYPTVRAERGDYQDVVLVWSEEVPTEFKFRVAQNTYTHFIGSKLTEELLGRMASYANSMIIRYVDMEYLKRYGWRWCWSGEELSELDRSEWSLGDLLCTR